MGCQERGGGAGITSNLLNITDSNQLVLKATLALHFHLVQLWTSLPIMTNMELSQHLLNPTNYADCTNDMEFHSDLAKRCLRHGEPAPFVRYRLCCEDGYRMTYQLQKGGDGLEESALKAIHALLASSPNLLSF